LTLEKKIFAYGKIWHILHISRNFSTLNSLYLHLLVYYKYMLNFQWGLFCKLGFGVRFFKLLHIKLDMNFLFTCTIGCVIYHFMCWCRSLSESWSAPINPPKYRKQTIMKLVEELEVKDTNHGYLPPYRPLVVARTYKPQQWLYFVGCDSKCAKFTRPSKCRWGGLQMARGLGVS
jgi:hypothetical protein